MRFVIATLSLRAGDFFACTSHCGCTALRIATRGRGACQSFASHTSAPRSSRPRAPQGGESAKVVTVSNGKTIAQRLAEAAQVSLGPIGLTLGGDVGERADGRTGNAMDLSGMEGEAATRDGNGRGESIATMTTEEWRRRYEEGGRVDLFVEEEFNAGSRCGLHICRAIDAKNA